MRVYTENGSALILSDDAFSEGGEGKVFAVTSAPEPYKNTCVKIYFDKYRTPQKAGKIRYMVNNPPASIKGKGFLIGWPLAVVEDDSRSFLGFVMYLAPSGSKELINLTATKVSKKLGAEWHQYYDRSNGKFALVNRLKMIHNIAIPLYYLHYTQKYVLKDFKPQNLLVTRNGDVTLVDMDSIQITEGGRLLYPGDVRTPDYTPPEYYNEHVGQNLTDVLNTSWDSFSIGVVFYQIMFGLHPYVVTPKYVVDDSSSEITDKIARNLFPFGENAGAVASYPDLHNKFSILPPTIQSLFKRAFSSNTQNRPGADEWGKATHELLKDVGPLATPPPPPEVRYRVRFLMPDGSEWRSVMVEQGKRITKDMVPPLPFYNGKQCPSWNKNPENDTIFANKDYQAIPPMPDLPPSSSSSSSSDDNGCLRIIIRLLIIAAGIGLIALRYFVK